MQVIYCFVFLGEFGYELLNWQGAIRKFCEKERNNTVIVATRKGMDLFYEKANLVIDISEYPMFKSSIATGYRFNNPSIRLFTNYDKFYNKKIKSQLYSFKNFKYIHDAKKNIRNLIIKELPEKYSENKIKFIFSDKYTVINKVRFGRKHKDKHDIYYNLDIKNNSYKKIVPRNDFFSEVEKKLGFSLSEKYILCQKANRSIVQRSKKAINENKLIERLAKYIRVVCLDFDTGRQLDSKSEFSNNTNYVVYSCDNFTEQSALIYNAKSCVFFTEGDFRSHNYLPPLMGKDVFSIADKSVFELPSAPIDYWNKNVFTFGGQIIPCDAEGLNDNDYVENLIYKILG